MRRIVVYELLSLDGVAEAPEIFFGWDDALDAELAAVIATQDAAISPTGYLLADFRVIY